MDIAQILAIVGIALSAVVLAATAAAETAIERASDVRISAVAARGETRALRIVSRLNAPRDVLGPLTLARVFSAAIGVTLAAYLGVRAYGPAGAVVWGLVAGLGDALVQMTVGLIVARQPEYAALQLSQVVPITSAILGVPSWILGLPARIIARSVRKVAPDMGTDILSLIEHEEAAGGVEEQERRMIRGIIGLEDKTAREIMVPRIDIGAVDVEDTIEDVAALVNERGFSRVPVYRENIDDIVGIIYAKDLLRAITNGGKNRKITEMLRQAVFIPESKKLDALLTEMQTTRTHMAIVVDEYGGTAGVVTIEDLLEEIVGEIEDEYDIARPPMEILSDDEVVLDASMPTETLRELFGYEVDSEDFDTVGGFLINQLGRLPAVGDEVTVNSLQLRVLSMAGRRIRRLRITRQHKEEPESANAR